MVDGAHDFVTSLHEKPRDIHASADRIGFRQSPASDTGCTLIDSRTV
jgi:hypothetical protein